ncbi:hypothetical protein GW17_00036040 [Ensete ventricosum]|nr:hypothetical protein GW17_00036040 [Ensete ventricosum]
MNDYDNTSEEATSARETKSTSDLESEVEVPEHDAAWPMPINAAWRPMPPPYVVAVARPPYVSTISRGTTKGSLWVTPPIFKEAFVHDRRPRDDPRDKPTELCIENPEGASIHAESFDPHQHWRTYALGREQVEPTPQLDS